MGLQRLLGLLASARLGVRAWRHEGLNGAKPYALHPEPCSIMAECGMEPPFWLDPISLKKGGRLLRLPSTSDLYRRILI